MYLPQFKDINKMYVINQYLEPAESNKILITMTPTAGFTAGITLFFASGTLSIDWKDGSASENFTSNVELTHTYSIAGTYIAEITGDFEQITKFYADTSRITSIDNLQTGLLTDIRIQSNLLSGTLDLSKATISGLFNCNSNPNLTGITFASSGNSMLNFFHFASCNLTGTLDLSNVPIGTGSGCYIYGWSNPNLTGITFASSGNGTVQQILLYSCNLTGTLDLSNLSLANSCTFYCYSNPNLTGITFASSGNGNIIYFQNYSCNLTGTLDLSNVPIGGTNGIFNIYSNPNLTGVTFASSGNGQIKNCGLYSCSLGYINLAAPNFNISVNSGYRNLKDNNMTASEVNQILETIYTLVSSEPSGGSYIGRYVNISGSNAAPDSSSGGYDGLTAKTNLQSKGFTVTTN